MCSHKVQLQHDQIAGVPAHRRELGHLTIPIYQYHFQKCMTEMSTHHAMFVVIYISTSQHLVTKIDVSREGHGHDSASSSCKLLNICR